MTPMPVELLDVFLNHSKQQLHVGRLALKNRQIYFEYSSDFLATELPLSPFHLPLQTGAILCEDKEFEGLFGVFNDSLPDGWGRLLLDRLVEKQGGNRYSQTPLDRLAMVGPFAMGALTYEPVLSNYTITNDDLQLSQLARDCSLLLDHVTDSDPMELLSLNGSSAGARPKIIVGLSADKTHLIHGGQTLPADFSHWMIKFPASSDSREIGSIEYAYSLMASAAGIPMPETHLFKGAAHEQHGTPDRFFGVKRFDRSGNQPIHMHSLCGLIHADHRTPSLDYQTVLKATLHLTKNVADLEAAFRLACFNVLAHNRDDHSKNFSYLMNAMGEWHLAPAYDLTFSYGPGGEQSTMAMGEGRNPGVAELLTLAGAFDLKTAGDVIAEVQTAVQNWKQFAEKAELSGETRALIWDHLRR
jgi:serine/threonine-protein kinase HipA